MPRFASHHCSSWRTHGEAAASGVAIRTYQEEPSRAASIVDHSAVFADMLASSRKTRAERGRYQGVAKRSIADCSAVASGCDAPLE